MSCSPCGYTYTTSPQFLMTGQHPSIPYPTSNAMPPESVHPGTNVCSLAYDPRLLGSPYGRIPELYAGSGYTDHVTASYMSGLASSHSAVLYPAALTSPYDMKDPRTAWAALPQAAGYACDPTFAAYGPYGDRFDPVDSEARRRNATRETTSTLKAWLNEHRKNPYPTKGEKIMLAIITKMTLTQVSTWFANARRRLKKENKMTWEPRNKTGDDLDDVSIDDDEDKDDDEQKDASGDGERNGTIQNDKKESEECNRHETKCNSENDTSSKDDDSQSMKLPVTDLPERRKTEDSIPTIEKPKIWSLAQTATSESPPTSRKHPLEHSSQEDLKRFRRMAFQENYNAVDGLMPSLCHRNIPRLQPDSSTESSLSSPPLWRDIHALTHSDKYGRVTPLDSSDLVSVSPSSTGSPAMVSASIDQRNSLSPSMTYSRLLGCRLLSCADSPTSGLRPPADHSHYYTQASSIPPSLDLRTFHPSFLKASPFAYPGGFSAPPPIQQTSPLTAISKGKSEDGQSDS